VFFLRRKVALSFVLRRLRHFLGDKTLNNLRTQIGRHPILVAGRDRTPIPEALDVRARGRGPADARAGGGAGPEARGGPVGRDPRAFYAVPLSNMLVFGTLIPFAFRARRNPQVHKRLIVLATTGLMTAAIARWPFAIVHRNAPVAMRFSYVFVLMLVLYDLWSTHKINRATLWAGAFLITVQELAFPIGQTAAWHAFAGWILSVVR